MCQCSTPLISTESIFLQLLRKTVPDGPSFCWSDIPIWYWYIKFIFYRTYWWWSYSPPWLMLRYLGQALRIHKVTSNSPDISTSPRSTRDAPDGRRQIQKGPRPGSEDAGWDYGMTMIWWDLGSLRYDLGTRAWKGAEYGACTVNVTTRYRDMTERNEWN